MPTTLKRTGHLHTQSSDSQIVAVAYLDIDTHWGQVKPLIERVLNRFDEFVTINKIYEDLKSSDRQLWLILHKDQIQAVILTMIESYRNDKVGYITHAAGEDFKAWESAVDPIADYFKAINCVKFVINGRRGWKRFLENRNFKEATTLFERFL